MRRSICSQPRRLRFCSTTHVPNSANPDNGNLPNELRRDSRLGSGARGLVRLPLDRTGSYVRAGVDRVKQQTSDVQNAISGVLANPSVQYTKLCVPAGLETLILLTTP